MSYSEEETRSYESMLHTFEIFKELKNVFAKNKCTIHNKKLKMEANWDKEYDVDIVISKACCLSFAEPIAKSFLRTRKFTSVVIELL